MRDSVVGLLLAAGAGRRMGRPKALVRDADGTSWLLRTIDVLREGGCAEVTVVVGAEASAARELLGDAPVAVVEAADWAEGMGASLRAGLTALAGAESVAEAEALAEAESVAGAESVAACVHLVDLPDVGADAVQRVLTAAAPDALARATYSGRPGHPVLLGRDHWAAAAATVGGDRGARTYLDAHGVRDIDCTDLATGRDVDRRS